MADDDKKKPAPQKPIEKRKEKKPKVDPSLKARIDSIDDGVFDANKNLDSLIAKTGNASNRAEQRADLLLQAADAQKKIDELAENGRAEDAAEMQKALDETSRLLKGSKTDIAIGNRLAELATINSDTASLIEKYGTKEEQATKANLAGIQGVIKRIERQTSLTEGDTLNVELGKQLKKLGGRFGQFSTQQTKQLQKAYDEANANLALPMTKANLPLIKAAQEQLEEIKKGADSEENRREARKLNEEANSRLLDIANGFENFGDKFDSVVSAGAKGAGILAGLTGLALLFIDPETFQAIMTDIITRVGGVFDTIYALVSGDFDQAALLFQENFSTFAGLIGALALLFGGKIIKFIGVALKAARVFRIFMFGTFIPTLIGMFSAMVTALTPIVIAMAPILVPVLAIMALIGGLYLGFKKLQDSLGPGASIMDTLKVGALYFMDFLSMLINGITFIPRKIIGFIGKRAAKWLFGDDVDTSMFDKISEGLDTGRGKRAAEEIRLKNEAAAAEKEKEKAEEEMPAEVAAALEGNMSVEDLTEKATTVDGDALAAESAELEAAKTGPSQTIAASVSNVTSAPTNNNVVSSTVIQQPLSQASAVLGSITSR